MRQPQPPSLLIRVFLKSNYTVTPAFATVTGLEIIVPKDGFYKLSSFFNSQVRDISANDARCYAYIAVNNIEIPNTKVTILHNDVAISMEMTKSTMLSTGKFLQKNDIVTLKVSMDAGDNTLITVGTLNESLLEIERE